MPDKKVRIDDNLLKKVKRYRNKSPQNKIKYPSDKCFVQMAILQLLKKDEKQNG